MGKVIWFCGLSGSGKTTIALSLKHKLEKLDRTVKIIDGDDIRSNHHKHLGFTPEDILENNRLILKMCVKQKSDYDYILVPIISPFIISREHARKILGKEYIELYVHTSLDECIKRDVKGLYKKALNGEIQNFIGIAKELPFEEPINPEVIVKTEIHTIQESVDKVLYYLKNISSTKNEFI